MCLSPAGALAATTVFELPLFLSHNDSYARQGFVRVLNLSDEAGDIMVEAIDEAGQSFGTFSLPLGGDESRHFNSDDVADYLGGSGTGNWRLRIWSDNLDRVLPTAYIRSPDGFLSPMTGGVLGWEDDDGFFWRWALTVNPASNVRTRSLLRIANPNATDLEVRVFGEDDQGTRPAAAYTFDLGAGETETLTTVDLERSWDMDGRGKWQVWVAAQGRLLVMNLLESTETGHLLNMSFHGVDVDPETTGNTGPFAPENEYAFLQLVKGKKVCLDACAQSDDTIYFEGDAIGGTQILDALSKTFAYFSRLGNSQGFWDYEQSGPNTGNVKLSIGSFSEPDDTCWSAFTFETPTSGSQSTRCQLSEGVSGPWRIAERP